MGPPVSPPDTSAELVLAYWDKNQTRTVKENIKSFNKKYPVSYTHLRAHET